MVHSLLFSNKYSFQSEHYFYNLTGNFKNQSVQKDTNNEKKPRQLYI